MRKLIFLIAFALLFSSCFLQKKNDAKTAVQESKPTVYEHNQVLYFRESGYDTAIYKEPFSSNVIYAVQKGDKIALSELWIYSNNRTYAKAETPAGERGFIYLANINPYRNGQFSYIKTLDLDGEKVRLLSLDSSGFYIGEGVFMHALPSDNSTIIHQISHTESSGENLCSATEITDDYIWVKVKMQEYTGWVKCKDLIHDKGGPIIKTPQTRVFFFLIGNHEI